MPTDLLDLPGYPGHAQARSFADECVRGISEDVLESDAALLAELGRRVASTASPSTRRARPQDRKSPTKTPPQTRQPKRQQLEELQRKPARQQLEEL